MKYSVIIFTTSFSSARTESKTQQNIELMTFALTWCANIFVGRSVTPTFFFITPVLYRLHWLPVSFRIEYKVLILTYKAIHGHAPPYISDLIKTMERTNYNLRSSSQLLLQPYNATKTKKTLGDRAFQVASPGLRNGLPNDIRNAKTMDVFKSLVKTHLFRKAYACYF